VPPRHARASATARSSAIARNVPSSNATLRKKYREVAEYRQKRLAFSRAYRAANKEEINRKRRIKNANPKVRAAVRDARLKRMYGISHADYEAMYKRQRGRCRICGVKKRTLFIDHKETDHKGKIVRGLLCHPCNVGLGFFRDDTKRMRRAIDYVKASLPKRRRRCKRKKVRRPR
jgi:hypothetical protein